MSDSFTSFYLGYFIGSNPDDVNFPDPPDLLTTRKVDNQIIHNYAQSLFKKIIADYDFVQKMKECYDNGILPENFTSFLKGIFESTGKYYEIETRDFFISIEINNEKLFNSIKEKINTINIINEHKIPSIIFRGSNALDFLGLIYDCTNPRYPDFIVTHKQATYLSLVTNITSLSVPTVRFVKTDEKAVIPSKQRLTDEGYDLTLICVDKVISDTITRYDTCLQCEPDPGWHIEILPRSSLSNTGYMLANSVGLIDSSYRGNLKVVLIKVDKNKPDISLPFKGLQLILRQNVHYICEEVDSLNKTTRQGGGFGSTG